MGHGAVNKLIGGTRPFPEHYMHPRGCLSGDLAEKQQVRKLPVEMSCTGHHYVTGFGVQQQQCPGSTTSQQQVLLLLASPPGCMSVLVLARSLGSGTQYRPLDVRR